MIKLLGHLALFTILICIGWLTGLYKAFVIHKALEYFLPQYSAIQITQIWAALCIYSIVTLKRKDFDTEDQKFMDMVNESIKNTSVTASGLSILWLSLYLVKYYT